MTRECEEKKKRKLWELVGVVRDSEGRHTQRERERGACASRK